MIVTAKMIMVGWILFLAGLMVWTIFQLIQMN
jgi:hypothetical protein